MIHPAKNNHKFVFLKYKNNGLGRAIAEAVSRWLHTTAALVRAQVW
jgi:predicted acetyltransferase